MFCRICSFKCKPIDIILIYYKHKQSAGPYSVFNKGSSSKEKQFQIPTIRNPFNTVIYAVEQLLQCERCLVWYRLDCAKVTNYNTLKVLDECEALHWFYNACNVKALEA